MFKPRFTKVTNLNGYVVDEENFIIEPCRVLVESDRPVDFFTKESIESINPSRWATTPRPWNLRDMGKARKRKSS